MTEAMTIVELATYLQDFPKVWSEGENEAFKEFIANDPEAGAVIPGTGGIRKVRWGREGSGKRGGARVIYYFYNESIPLFLITVYAKAAKESLSQAEKKTMKQLTKRLAEYGQDDES